MVHYGALHNAVHQRIEIVLTFWIHASYSALNIGGTKQIFIKSVNKGLKDYFYIIHYDKSVSLTNFYMIHIKLFTK